MCPPSVFDTSSINHLTLIGLFNRSIITKRKSMTDNRNGYLKSPPADATNNSVILILLKRPKGNILEIGES